MTPDNVARSKLRAWQEAALWLSIAGILATAIWFA